jgi:hypothetical protein
MWSPNHRRCLRTNVKEPLNRLVVVVRPIAPAVADALAKDAQSAADWCKATGMANLNLGGTVALSDRVPRSGGQAPAGGQMGLLHE